MRIVEEKLALSTIADGSGSGNGETLFYGLLFAVRLAIGTLSTPTITLTFTGTDGVSTTLLTLTGVSASGQYPVRHQVCDSDGASLVLNSDDDPMVDMAYVGGKLAWTISGGGATTTGTLTAVMFV